MTQAEIDKLTDELIDVRDELDGARWKIEKLQDKIDEFEDWGSQIARVLGCEPSHADVLARAKELASFARVA